MVALETIKDSAVKQSRTKKKVLGVQWPGRKRRVWSYMGKLDQNKRDLLML